jgi:hypothetical protein
MLRAREGKAPAEPLRTAQHRHQLLKTLGGSFEQLIN